MSLPPVSEDIAATFASFYVGGNGSTHTELTAAFVGSGFGEAAPYNELAHTPIINRVIADHRAASPQH